MVEAAATVAPSGKQNSFAAHGRAQYLLAERGDGQPRTLAGAFARPVGGADIVVDSIAALTRFQKDLDDAYGPASAEQCVLHVGEHGTLRDLVAFAQA